MSKLSFNITIQAPKEKVWNVLWTPSSYEAWTSVFSEGSTAISDWNQGSKIQFLDGKGSGMYSIIHKKVPNTEMTFKHMGEIKEGVEKESEWAGALESYYLTETNGSTDLKVEMDMNEEYKTYFEQSFPKALELVKQLSET